jgi:hypothetical protein
LQGFSWGFLCLCSSRELIYSYLVCCLLI